jgi:hypothetical protein
MTGQEIADLLRRHKFRTQNEDELQQAIAIVLTRVQQVFEREVVLSPIDRIDFMLPNGIGIEVKVAGSSENVLRQLHRYAKVEAVKEIILVSKRFQAGRQPHDVGGKPVHVVFVHGGFA